MVLDNPSSINPHRCRVCCVESTMDAGAFAGRHGSSLDDELDRDTDEFSPSGLPMHFAMDGHGGGPSLWQHNTSTTSMRIPGVRHSLTAQPLHHCSTAFAPAHVRAICRFDLHSYTGHCSIVDSVLQTRDSERHDRHHLHERLPLGSSFGGALASSLRSIGSHHDSDRSREEELLSASYKRCSSSSLDSLSPAKRRHRSGVLRVVGVVVGAPWLWYASLTRVSPLTGHSSYQSSK